MSGWVAVFGDMPMSIVDPGFRPRLMLAEAQALALVQRACSAAARQPALLASGGVRTDPGLAQLVRQHSSGDSVTSVQVSHMQRLWGGMGAVLEVRARTGSGVEATLIVKHIELPAYAALSVGDERKRASYECEAKFFETAADELRRVAGCHVPAGLLVDRSDDGKLNIVMSKLPKRGTSNSRSALQLEDTISGDREQGEFSSESDEPDNTNMALSTQQTEAAIDFLAKLHGHTWGSRADAFVARGLQPRGSYWYLDTRLDEWEAMPQQGWEGRLRRAARAIDRRLLDDTYQCIIHGDAKADNMNFDEEGAVSMCDFQYCGRESPMKDLAYLLCCASESGCSPASSDRHLGRYHATLCSVLKRRAENENAEPSGGTEKLDAKPPELSVLKVTAPAV